MSIKKEYGLNLLESKALWEYRRRKSRINVGDKIILYATSPNNELIGEFVVGEVISGSPEELWERTRNDVCYQEDEVTSYLKSGNFPIAFKVNSPKKYSQAISTSKIPSFKPPMSYCKVSEEIATIIESL